VNPSAQFRANICNSKRVMGNKQNLKWRPSPSWIYYYCPFFIWPISCNGWLHSCKITLI